VGVPAVTRRRVVVLVLALLIGACTTTRSLRSSPAPKTTARDAEILVHGAGRTHFFENRRPHCLSYVLEGEWEFAAQQAALRSTDRRRFVGVVLQNADPIQGAPSGDLVARALAQIIADTEKEWGARVQARVESFPASQAGAVLLEFEDLTLTPQAAARATESTGAVRQTIRLPLRVIAPFDASLVMIVTALDVTDARAIFSTLEVTEDPQCWRRAIRERFPGALR
jgi:hypothetical protein